MRDNNHINNENKGQRVKTLFEFIKDNWRTWPTNADFAKAHEMSPQRLNGWIKAGAVTDGEGVFSGITGKPLAVDGVILKIRS